MEICSLPNQLVLCRFIGVTEIVFGHKDVLGAMGALLHIIITEDAPLYQKTYQFLHFNCHLITLKYL